MKKMILAYGLLILVIVIIILVKSDSLSFLQEKITPSYAEIGNKRFSLLVAQTEKEKLTGLSNMNKLSDNQAMLFVFDKKDYHTFWMRNMKFPIDILFIDGNTIIDLYENLQPPQKNADIAEIPRYQPKKPVNYVLEINGGLSKKFNLKVGNKVNIKLPTK